MIPRFEYKAKLFSKRQICSTAVKLIIHYFNNEYSVVALYQKSEK